MKNLIDLERKYIPISFNEEDLESLTIKSQFARLDGKRFGHTLQELVKNPLSAVLGEARSGKTTEFGLACRKLNKEGKFAFFIRLEDLIHPGVAGIEAISNALEVEEEGRFEEWIKGNKEAAFFLDAVDEAKLQNPNHYPKAIRNFHKSLREHLFRCRVVVSCRVSEWRPQKDLEPLKKLGSSLIKPNVSSNGDKIFQLCPLDGDQIKKIAYSRNLDEIETEEFLRELKAAGAVDYAGRPGDALELADLWKSQHRLGTLTEITEQNIFRKLNEDSEVYEAKISVKKARSGAERLAAATTFCSQNFFRIAPPEEDPKNLLPALDPFKLLPEWSRDEVKALLRRPIFDEATYGRVRFHTRTVREYLAASWLKSRHEQGCPAKEILNIFFATRYGKTVLRRQFSSVAAWLAPHSSEFFDALCKYNPEVFPDEGDPEALTVEQRAEILKSFVKRYSDRDYTGFWYDFQKLKRFASPELSKCIATLLQKTDITIHAKKLLLHLVQTEKIPGCSKEVLKIALNKKEDEAVRIAALQALEPYKTTEELKKIHEELNKDFVPRDYFGWALSVLYPKVIGPQEFLDLVAAIPQKGFARPDRLKERIRDILEKENAKGRLKVLIPGLWKLINSYHSPGDSSEKPDPCQWLIDGIVKGISNWFQAGGSELPNLFELLDFFEDESFFDYQERKLVDTIKKAFYKAPAKLRRSYFHHRFSLFYREHKKDEIYLFQVLNYDGILNLIYEDLDWLIEDALHTDDTRYRFTAFDAAIRVCLSEKEKCDPTKKLRLITDKYPDLVGHLQKLVRPAVDNYELASKLRAEVGPLKTRWQEILFMEDILPHLAEISSGKDEARLAKIFRCFQRIADTSAPSSFETLIPLIGQKGVSAFRSGLIKFWEKWEPDNQRKIGDGMAVLGVSCSLDEGMSFVSLSPPQISKLIKLALKEFNLPKWFGELIKSYPELVASKIKPVILNGLTYIESQTSNQNEYPSFFANIIREYPELVDLLQNDLFDWAQKHIPLSHNTRTHIVRAFSAKEHRRHLKFLAEEHFKAQENLTGNDKLFWLAVWLQVDAPKALDQLEEALDMLEPKQADDFILHLTNILYQAHGYETGFQGRPDYQSVDALARFIPIVFAHIRFEDDPEREGMWTPNERDHAQGFRNELVESLAQLPGKRSVIELQKIMDGASDKGVKAWLLRALEEKVDRESPLIWDEEAILEFERNHECDPVTVDDLFAIGIKRLTEIKHEIEKKDFGLKSLFKKDTDESELQKYIAQRLQDLSRGRYSLPVRESEVARGKKPDIRLIFKDIPPLPIEIKWAHKWSCRELESSLQDQLVDQYLRDPDTTHGILLLVNANRRKTWLCKSKRKNFNSLIRHLEGLAHDIESNKPGVASLKVIGIDLTNDGN